MKIYLGALSSIGPGLAVHVEVVAVILALVAGERAPLEHPARILLALALLGPSGAVARIKK